MKTPISPRMSMLIARFKALSLHEQRTVLAHVQRKLETAQQYDLLLQKIRAAGVNIPPVHAPTSARERALLRAVDGLGLELLRILYRAKIFTVWQLRTMSKAELRLVRGITDANIREIDAALVAHGTPRIVHRRGTLH